MQRDFQSTDETKREGEYMSYRGQEISDKKKKDVLTKEVSEAMRAAERRLEEASDIIASQRKRIESQELDLADATREIKKLQSNLGKVKEKFFLARDRRDERELAEAELRERLAELEARPEHDLSIKKLKSRVEELEKERDESFARERELMRKLKHERKQTQSLGEKLSPLKAQLEERNRYTDKLAARLRKFEIEERHTSKRKSNRNESPSNSESITRLKRQIKALKLANRELKSDLEAARPTSRNSSWRK